MFELIPWRTQRRHVARPRRDLFDWFFDDFAAPELRKDMREWIPALDVSETEDEVIVKAEVPGIDVKDIDITLTDGLLTIRGERKLENEDKKENFHRIERQFGSFSRSLKVGAEVKADAIEANYKDGVLTVSLPKSEEKKPKKIDVKS